MNTSKAIINLVIFLNFVILHVSSGSEDISSLIYGGKPAGSIHINNGEKRISNDGQYPYIVEIAKGDEHVCGGALLKKDIVVTAAHCFMDIPICDVRIWAGSYKKIDKKSDDVQIRDVYDVVIHHMYNTELDDIQSNDIALVFLKEAFDLTPFVQTVTVATKMQRDQFMGTTVVIMGYGRMEENKKSTKLLLAEVSMLKKHDCALSLRKALFTSTMLCVKCKNDVCTVGTGDSGGPLVKIDKHGKHLLLGIASYAFQKPKSEISSASKPAVYMDVAEYKEWIKSIKKSKKPKTNRFLNWCKGH